MPFGSYACATFSVFHMEVMECSSRDTPAHKVAECSCSRCLSTADNHTKKKKFSTQCCQLSDFVAIFSEFSDPSSDSFSKKRLATNLATFSGVIGDL